MVTRGGGLLGAYRRWSGHYKGLLTRPAALCIEGLRHA